jgi:hypothetical protein
MPKSFDFNSLIQEALEVKLSDAAGTVLHVTTPPERLIEQLAASVEELTNMGPNQGIEKVRASYTLAAALMSCNLEGVQVTADELREKYKVPPMALAAFTAAYMDFINDFHQAKNWPSRTTRQEGVREDINIEP